MRDVPAGVTLVETDQAGIHELPRDVRAFYDAEHVHSERTGLCLKNIHGPRCKDPGEELLELAEKQQRDRATQDEELIEIAQEVIDLYFGGDRMRAVWFFDAYALVQDQPQ